MGEDCKFRKNDKKKKSLTKSVKTIDIDFQLIFSNQFVFVLWSVSKVVSNLIKTPRLIKTWQSAQALFAYLSFVYIPLLYMVTTAYVNKFGCISALYTSTDKNGHIQSIYASLHLGQIFQSCLDGNSDMCMYL